MSKPNDDKAAVFPMSGWNIGTHKHSNSILLQPLYLATMMDSPDTPQTAQTFALSPKIARELAQKLIELAGQMEIDEPASEDTLKH